LTYGYKNVKAYEGGLEEWEAAGLAIEQDKTETESEVSAAHAGAVSCH
jgi:3-mercaptopyruvate sulfurtransferase SseA